MKSFHRTIVFTKTPLKSYFRYKDLFQIYPADFENMPKSRFQKHHPIVLEYLTDESEERNVPSDFEGLRDIYLLLATTLTLEDKILNLLSVISNNLFFRYYDLTGAWGIPILEDNPGKKANLWASKWNMALFHWPELPKQLIIENFTIRNEPEIEYKNHFDYYFKEPSFDLYSNSTITFPDSIHKVLDSYFSKTIELQSILDTALSFSVSAVELMQHKKTLSILASFTSIETMVNLEFQDFKPEQCEACGQLKYKVHQKYLDYFLKYIGSSNHNKQKFSAYYKLRSKIVHTGQRLKTENIYSEFTKDEEEKGFLNQVEILQLGKMAIVQWLLRNDNQNMERK